jgi:hypothetical protein
VKAAADDAEVVYNLVGQLHLSPSGWLLLSVPNPLVRGVFAAMHEPGLELPPGPSGGPMNAHITVMRPEELTQIGGADLVTERGKQYHYTLGRLYAVAPTGFQDVAKAYVIRVHSPELQTLRRSYGLSSLPNDGAYDFHITVGVVKRGVLGRNETGKGDAPVLAGDSEDEGRGERVLLAD